MRNCKFHRIGEGTRACFRRDDNGEFGWSEWFNYRKRHRGQRTDANYQFEPSTAV